jgi:hypothetical protein
VKKRFKLFLVGFIIGIIVVIFTYGEKSSSLFSWTPEGRVLKRLRLTEKVISDSMQCVLDCNQFDENDWKAMYKIGDVNFSKARTKPYPIYSVSMENDTIAFTKLTFLAKDEESILIDFQGAISICDCP